mmetsp:Transcript_98976/g.288652  ORF Transcript_98976/g.288652 Transcript_98976/m.288652 type:complete len:93 (+) Transcript_98976:263-541(+)
MVPLAAGKLHDSARQLQVPLVGAACGSGGREGTRQWRMKQKEQRPQLRGQRACMNPLLCSHWPMDAHAPQRRSLSRQSSHSDPCPGARMPQK